MANKENTTIKPRTVGDDRTMAQMELTTLAAVTKQGGAQNCLWNNNYNSRIY